MHWCEPVSSWWEMVFVPIARGLLEGETRLLPTSTLLFFFDMSQRERLSWEGHKGGSAHMMSALGGGQLTKEIHRGQLSSASNNSDPLVVCDEGAGWVKC